MEITDSRGAAEVGTCWVDPRSSRDGIRDLLPDARLVVLSAYADR